MTGKRALRASEWWFGVLLRFYPPDFRDDMGQALLEAYRDRARAALQRGVFALAGLWLRALVDALRNGPGARWRPAVSWRRSGNWGRDIELATRRLVRAPLFVVAMLGTLTAGLGAFAIVHTVVRKVVIEPLPYEHPDDLYFVWRDYGPIFDLKRGWVAGTDVAELEKAGGVIEDAAGMQRQNWTFATSGSDPFEISVVMTTPNLFRLLGVAPALGRDFAPTEGGPGRPPLVMLTHELWNRLGADAAIVGSTVQLNGQPFTVIGVMPRDFTFVRHASLGPPEAVDAYVTSVVKLEATNPNGGSYAGLIRARRGTDPTAVAAAVDAAGEIVDARDFKGRGLELYSVPLGSDLIAGVRPALLMLGVAGWFLVVVLMVNLASVLLARAAQRQHEFAVSRALGADGFAIVRAMVVEGGLLGLAGGAAAALVAVWGVRALVGLGPLELPRAQTIAVDWRVAVVVIGVGGLLGLLAASVPAAWAARTSLPSLLASSAVRGGGGHGRLRRSMVVAQVALSLVLLSAGGLVVRSFERLLRTDPGFKPQGVLAVRVPMHPQLVREPADVRALQRRVHEGLRAIPGAVAVSAADALPLSAGSNQTTISIPGAPGITGNSDRDRPLVDYIGTRAGYVETMGMRVVAGRPFSEERRDGVREALIDRHLAAQFFPNSSPLGATIPFNNNILTIVGVVDQARLYRVHEDGRPQLYVRAEDWNYRNLSFVVRTDRDPHAVIPEMRAVIGRVDPRLARSDVRTLEDLVGESLGQQRLSAALVGGFALGALLLAATGLFGVVAGSVTRRGHELAVRLALGARHRSVLGLVLGEGARLVGLGILVGVPGLYLAGGVIRAVLVDVPLWDVPTLVLVGVSLATVAMLACYLPARRVLGIHPARSLHQD